MKSYKEKISHFKSDPSQAPWEDIESRLVQLNKNESSLENKRVIGFLLFVIMSLTISATYYAMLLNRTENVKVSEGDTLGKIRSTIFYKSLPTTPNSKIDDEKNAYILGKEKIIQTSQLSNIKTSIEVLAASKSSKSNLEILDENQIFSKKTIIFKTESDTFDQFIKKVTGHFQDSTLLFNNETISGSCRPLIETKTLSTVNQFLKTNNEINTIKPCICDANPEHLYFGIGAGISKDHYYPGEYVYFTIQKKMNKLLNLGLFINHQRFKDSDKHTLQPEITGLNTYSNLGVHLGLILYNGQKLSYEIDIVPSILLVNQRLRYFQSTEYVYRFNNYIDKNMLVGAEASYNISRNWKIGLHCIADAKSETILTGIQVKYLIK